MSLVTADFQAIEHFINGQFVGSTSKETFPDINPATGEAIAPVALGTPEDVEQAVAAAKDAFESGPWPRMSVKERCQILRRIGDLIMQYKEALAEAETRDTGKPIRESLEGDIPRAASNFHFFSEYAPCLNEECFTVNEKERHIAIREPIGVVALITPWNLPLYLASWKIAPCLAMGNTCVLKPAEWTPYTAFLLGHIVQEAGLPAGVLNIVHGFGSGGAGEVLTVHKDVNCISFTGETATGITIMTAAAPTLKKLSFELGGKGATIIFANADLDDALDSAVQAAYRNQGQICLAGSRLFVQEGVFNTVINKLLMRVRKLKIGNPLDFDTQMGAIISKEQLAKVESYIELGKKEGKLLTGGERLADLPCGNFLSPAVFTELSYDSRFCQEEIFGPVLPVIPFKSEEEAIKMANSTKYGLSTSIWSLDVNCCHRVSAAIKTGVVWVNCWFARDLRTPFGGQKQSGIGREGGRYGLDFFSELKTICYRYKS